MADETKMVGPTMVPVEETNMNVNENEHENEKIGSISSSVAGLSENEKSIIDRQTKAPSEKVGYFALFRYADKKDAAVMLVATIASIVAGACLPLMTVSGCVDE
jgi:ATP-binding cassette subfamily B (MDR/TAP) protein 1